MLNVKRVRELARERGFPEAGLSDALMRALAREGVDVAHQTINGWLRGAYEPMGRNLIALARVLGCKPEDLL